MKTTPYKLKSLRLFAALAFALALGGAFNGLGQENGIQVVGAGKASAKPDAVKLTGTISAEAELAADAVTKFHANKRRVETALEGLGLQSLTSKGSGIAVSSGAGDAQAAQMAAMRGQPMPDLASKVSVNETLDIELGGVEKLDDAQLLDTVVRILDAVKDAGLNVAPEAMNAIQVQIRGAQPASLAMFKLSDAEPLRQKAYAMAMQDAKTKAERLAKLSSVKLGKVVSIRETPTVDSNSRNPTQAYYAMMFGMGAEGEDELTSPSFKEIPVEVKLQVVFAIE